VTKKKNLLLPALGATVVLAAGGAGAYWIFTQRGPTAVELPVGSKVIPQDAVMTISISTDEAQWKQFRQFGTKETQTAFMNTLAQARDRVLADNGLSYPTDIQPWIGSEVTFAVLPPAASENQGSAAQQPLMMVAPIAKPGKARKVLENPKAPEGAKWVKRDYKGVAIQETQGAVRRDISVAVLDNRFLVVTTDPKVTDRVIDGFQGGLSIAQTPGITKAMGTLNTSQPFGKIFVNLPSVSKLAEQNPNASIPPANLAQLNQNQGLAATMTLKPDGILFQGVSWLKQDAQQQYTVENAAKSMPNRLPASTVMMASGGNLQKLWQQYTEASAAAGGPVDPDRLQQSIQTATGLDFQKDLLDWMKGEFALAVIPAPQGGSSNFPVGIVLMVQASNRGAADAALKKLDDAMAKRYRVTVAEEKVADKAVTTWSVLPVGKVVTRGWLDGNVAFLNLLAPVASEFTPKPQATLAASPVFTKGVPMDLRPNNGHFFLNMQQVLALDLPFSQLPPQGQALTKAIQTIGVTAAISNSRTVRYDIFVGISKTGQPAPLPSPQVLPPAPKGEANPPTAE